MMFEKPRGGHRTFKLWLSGHIFKLGWGHSTKFQWKLGYRSSNIEVVGWSVGRPAGRPVPDNNNTTLWLHLASWHLLDSQFSWKSKMEPSVATMGHRDNRTLGHRTMGGVGVPSYCNCFVFFFKTSKGEKIGNCLARWRVWERSSGNCLRTHITKQLLHGTSWLIAKLSQSPCTNGQG